MFFSDVTSKMHDAVTFSADDPDITVHETDVIQNLQTSERRHLRTDSNGQLLTAMKPKDTNSRHFAVLVYKQQQSHS
jgi:hypothetical protein